MWHLLSLFVISFPAISAGNCPSCCREQSVCVCCSEGCGPRFAITWSKEEHFFCQNHDECRDILTLHRTPNYPHYTKLRHTKAKEFYTSCNLLGVLSLLSTWELTSASQVILPWWCLR